MLFYYFSPGRQLQSCHKLGDGCDRVEGFTSPIPQPPPRKSGRDTLSPQAKIKKYLTASPAGEQGQGLSRQKLQKTMKDANKVFRPRTTMNSQDKLLPSKFLEGIKLTLMLNQAEFII